MATTTARSWVLLLLAVIGRSASFTLPPVSAPGLALAPPPAPAVVSTLVGKDTVLPCSWQHRLSHLSQSVPHVQWSLESSGPVLEQRGSERWVSPDISDRAHVSESGLQAGDCSLLLQDVQVSDGGQYHAYMILDQDQTQTESKTGTNTQIGVFIGSVKLLVFDHRSVENKCPGEDLVLDLYTPCSMSLFFQGSNSSEWKLLWTRDGQRTRSRVQMDSEKNRLLLRSVSKSDQGIYKVLDLQGLTVSSTRLSVDQHTSTARKFTFEDYLRGDGDKIHMCAWLLTASLFMASLFLL